MSEARVIFSPTRIEMLNQVLARVSVKAVQVLVGESPQQQLRLIEPRGMRGGVEGTQPRAASEVALGVRGNMRAPVVQDDMDAAGSGVAPFDLPHSPQEMLMVVFLQTPPQHRAIIDIQGHQQMDNPLPLILELASLNLPRDHAASGGQPTQGLDVGLFIHTDHQFPAPVEPVHVLVTPQDLGCQTYELLVQPRGLPVAAAM